MAEVAAARDEALFVRTVQRVTFVLITVTVLLSVPELVADPRWQRVFSFCNSASLLLFVAQSVRVRRQGRPGPALEWLFVGVFVVSLLSIATKRGTHTALALALSLFVISTGARVLPAARTTKWVYAVVALGLLLSLFDIVELPTQLIDSAGGGRNFLTMVLVALGVFMVVLVHEFPRYPVVAKLTVGFLFVALAPLLIFARLAGSIDVADTTTARIAALAAAAGASVVAFFFSRLIASPLADVAGAMDRFTAGDPTVRARVRAHDEIGVLADRFNALAEQISGLLASLRSEVAQRTAKEAELHKLNEALAAARDRADAGSRAKSSFLAQMSHELRTPLNAVIGYTELIAEDAAASGHADIQGDAARITYAARHLLGLIDDILDLSKIEAGQAELVCEEFDAVALARATADATMTMIRDGGNAFSFTATPASVAMYSDPRKLRQALFNLLSNAAKFTQKRRIDLDIRAEPEHAPDSVVFAVRDEGIGIPPERIHELFRPFSQLDNSPTRRYQGTGLGLAITRRFCELLRGQVSVTSTPGVGSTFIIRLPIRIEAQSVQELRA